MKLLEFPGNEFLLSLVSKVVSSCLYVKKYSAAMVVKKMIGDDLFTDNWEKARRQITKRRADRRKNMDELAVTDPELFNQIKIRKQEKETARRKRRLEEKKLNPSGTAKVKKLNTVESL